MLLCFTKNTNIYKEKTTESNKRMMWTWCWSVQDINDIQKPLMTEEEERLYYERWSWFPSSSRQNSKDST